MAKRKIIEIDEEKCNGCGKCIPDCPEGALQVIDSKARLVSDLFCDGLGACVGSCPVDAMHVVEREAEPYDEKKTMANIVKHGMNTVKAHLVHLKEHNETEYLNRALEFLKEEGLENPLEDGEKKEDKGEARGNIACGCPGSMVRDMRKENKKTQGMGSAARQESELRQWPVQLMLVPPNAPYFDAGELLIAADCVPFAYANFHSDFLKDKPLVIGCPKLDDINFYKKKLADIFRMNGIKKVTVAHMEVPCCYGLQSAVEEAAKDSGKDVKVKEKIISVSGDIKGQ